MQIFHKLNAKGRGRLRLRRQPLYFRTDGGDRGDASPDDTTVLYHQPCESLEISPRAKFIIIALRCLRFSAVGTRTPLRTGIPDWRTKSLFPVCAWSADRQAGARELQLWRRTVRRRRYSGILIFLGGEKGPSVIPLTNGCLLRDAS